MPWNLFSERSRGKIGSGVLIFIDQNEPLGLYRRVKKTLIVYYLEKKEEKE